MRAYRPPQPRSSNSAMVTVARRPCAAATDCPGGACGAATCVGGSAGGSDCEQDADCPGGECGAALFDFRPRMTDGGPIAVARFGSGLCQDSLAPCRDDAQCPNSRCVAYRVTAEDPVPLEDLIESADLFVSVVPEALDGRDLNGDGDTTDNVLLLADRRTGRRQPIGVATAPGRAATRISELPFSFPAVAVERDITAFLEAEPLQGQGDENDDGDQFDTILRVFRSRGGCRRAHGRSAVGRRRGIEIDSLHLAVSDGVVWFRVREAFGAAQRITRVSVASNGSQGNGRSRRANFRGRPAGWRSRAPRNFGGSGRRRRPPTCTIATQRPRRRRARLVDLPPHSPAAKSLPGDGRYVAVTAHTNDFDDQVFIYDRDADGNGIFDERGGTATVPGSTHQHSSEFDPGPARYPAITPSGRFIGFLSVSDTLDGIGSGIPDKFGTWVHDRDPSEDGIFESINEGVPDVGNRLGSRNNLGAAAASASIAQPPSLSADGRYVAFASLDPNLPLRDLNNFCLNPQESRQSCSDIIVRDFVRPFTELISVSSTGEQSNNQSLTPALSADGATSAFLSAGTLVPGDTSGATDIFVRDVDAGVTERVSIASDGTQGDAPSSDHALALSSDGRFVVFGSVASTLVPGDTNARCDNDLDGRFEENCSDIFVHDRLTGFTRRVSLDLGGAQGDRGSVHPSLAADGETIAFESAADNLVAGDDNTVCDLDRDGVAAENCEDVFVAEPDPAAAQDRNGDGDVRDTLLYALDTSVDQPTPLAIAAADQVAVFGSCAVFLSPEASQGAGVDLNGDGDAADSVVQLACRGDAGGVQLRNLRRAAAQVALSDRVVAARVVEADQGGADLNGDGDADDTVLQVAERGQPDEWTNTGEPAVTEPARARRRGTSRRVHPGI